MDKHTKATDHIRKNRENLRAVQPRKYLELDQLLCITDYTRQLRGQTLKAVFATATGQPRSLSLRALRRMYRLAEFDRQHQTQLGVNDPRYIPAQRFLLMARPALTRLTARHNELKLAHLNGTAPEPWWPRPRYRQRLRAVSGSTPDVA